MLNKKNYCTTLLSFFIYIIQKKQEKLPFTLHIEYEPISASTIELHLHVFMEASECIMSYSFDNICYSLAQ